MLAAMASFTLMAVAGRELSTELNTAQILFYRSVVGVLVTAVLLQYFGWAQLRSRLYGLHVLRNIAHFGGQYGWFFGLSLLPMAEVIAIEFTVPVWTAILAVLLLGERMSSARLLALLLGVLGMWIILRPGVAVIQPATLAVLMGAMGYGLSHTLTRRLAVDDSSLAIVFYMALLQLPIAFVFSGGELVMLSSGPMWLWVVLVGVTALSAHYCMANALRYADATVVIPMDFLRLPLIAVLGYLFYGETVSVFVLIGALFMMLGNWINIKKERSH